jgi:hypothetical protein
LVEISFLRWSDCTTFNKTFKDENYFVLLWLRINPYEPLWENPQPCFFEYLANDPFGGTLVGLDAAPRKIPPTTIGATRKKHTALGVANHSKSPNPMGWIVPLDHGFLLELG